MSRQETESVRVSSHQMTGAKKTRLKPKLRVALLIVVALILLGGLAWGVLVAVHSDFLKHKTNGTSVNKPNTAPATTVSQAYLNDVQAIKAPAGVDKSGVLEVQMAASFGGEDYNAAIDYASELLDQPGHKSDTEALQYLARSYQALGKTTEQKQTDKKIVNYYDAHPDEKAGRIGTNRYNEAQVRLKG